MISLRRGSRLERAPKYVPAFLRPLTQVTLATGYGAVANTSPRCSTENACTLCPAKGAECLAERPSLPTLTRRPPTFRFIIDAWI